MTEEAGKVAERIREERAWCGFGRAQVALAVGLSEAEVAALEDGLRQPTEKELERLTSLFRLASVARLQGEPVAESPHMACLMRAHPVKAVARFQMSRFAEYLANAGTAPR